MCVVESAYAARKDLLASGCQGRGEAGQQSGDRSRLIGARAPRHWEPRVHCDLHAISDVMGSPGGVHQQQEPAEETKGEDTLSTSATKLCRGRTFPHLGQGSLSNHGTGGPWRSQMGAAYKEEPYGGSCLYRHVELASDSGRTAEVWFQTHRMVPCDVKSGTDGRRCCVQRWACA